MGIASSAGQTAFHAFGANAVTVFGLSPAERARRFAIKAGLRPAAEAPRAGPVIEADLDYAWDPAWLGWVKGRPGRAVTYGEKVALAHYPDAGVGGGLDEVRDGAADPGLYNEALRKRQDAYLLPLTPANRRAIEKASYDGAYKGVTDLLTLYLWRGIAFHLTRWAAAARISPNTVTAVGIAFCVWAFFLFRDGQFWAGLGVGLVFMVLDTVDGKLARCTGTSSAIGNVLDHGVDLIHPPFWWWAWGVGLAGLGQPFGPGGLELTIGFIVLFYVGQRAVEGAFMRRFGGIHIHVWRPIDSRFRLVTARRNPNMVILFGSLLVGEPKAGLIAVAWWTAISCVFHVSRLAQAEAWRASGRPVVSWLAG